MSVSYLSEKLGSAVNAMATSAAPIHKRLEFACIGSHTISDERSWEGFKDRELAARWFAWWERMTAVEAQGDEGRIMATINAMSDREAEEAAEELFDIFLNFERAKSD